MRKAALLVSIFFLITCSFAVAAVPSPHDGWSFSAVRTEQLPNASVLMEANGKYALVISGNGQGTADGRWTKKVPVTAGAWVQFTTRCAVSNIPEPRRLVHAALQFLNSSGGNVGLPEFPSIPLSTDSTNHRVITGKYKVPTGATHVLVELRFRWHLTGTSTWRDTALVTTTAVPQRLVKIATVNHRPSGTGSSTVNLNQFATYIDQAGVNKADIVLLPEAVTFIGTGKTAFAVAEAIPGPSTSFLGTVAKRNNCYIVAGLYERSGTGMYNVAVLIGRDGSLIGKYRKVCLPREEIIAGFAPGNSYPVFTTNFGKIGMMICWDVSYPEMSRNLSWNGAEIIFMPIWGGNEILCKARAIENQIPLAIAGYDIRSAVYDKAGTAIAQAPSTASTVVYTTIDMNSRMMWQYIGDWKSRIWLEGPPR